MLEVCVDTVQAAIDAERAGAQRLELCAALEVGGVTPCRSLIDAVRSAVQCPLIVLVRPRTGDFVYDANEVSQSLASVREAMAAGADGVAVGGLLPTGVLDLPFLSAVRDECPHGQLVMHRAFDYVNDPVAALEQLIALGFQRVLSSGLAPSALEGTATLRALNEQAAGRISIMPGGGVRAANALEILHTTACTELHGSFRRIQQAQQATDSKFGHAARLDAGELARCRALCDAFLANT